MAAPFPGLLETWVTGSDGSADLFIENILSGRGESHDENVVFFEIPVQRPSTLLAYILLDLFSSYFFTSATPTSAYSNWDLCHNVHRVVLVV